MVGSASGLLHHSSRSVLGKHVVFGKAIRGYDDVVKRISEMSVDAKDRPKVPVTISNCGELELRKKQDNAQGGHSQSPFLQRTLILFVISRCQEVLEKYGSQ